MKTIKIKTLCLKEVKQEYTICEKILTPKNIFNISKKIGHNTKSQEYAYLYGIDNSNNVNLISNVAIGSISNCHLDCRTIFQYLYMSNSSKFIITHNHPSNSLTISKQDIELTKVLKEQSSILNFEFLDHIIIAQKDYISLKENGFL